MRGRVFLFGLGMILSGTFSLCDLRHMLEHSYVMLVSIGTLSESSKTVWPSGLRRWLKAPVRKGVGSNPTGVNLHSAAHFPRALAVRRGTQAQLSQRAGSWRGRSNEQSFFQGRSELHMAHTSDRRRSARASKFLVAVGATLSSQLAWKLDARPRARRLASHRGSADQA